MRSSTLLLIALLGGSASTAFVVPSAIGVITRPSTSSNILCRDTSSPSMLMMIREQEDDDEQKTMKKNRWKKILRILPGVAAVPLSAQAAPSGGRMGGSFSRSSSSSSSRSSSSPRSSSRSRSSRSSGSSSSLRRQRSYSRPSYSERRQIRQPWWAYENRGSQTVIIQPTGRPGMARNSNPASPLFSIGLFSAIIGLSAWSRVKKRDNDDNIDDGDLTTICKIVVSLSVPDRDDPSSILSVLERLAQTSNTESQFGVSSLTNEVALLLLRQSSSVTAAAGTVDTYSNYKKADRDFAKLSVTERSKFDKETVSSYNGVQLLGLDTTTTASPSDFQATMAVVELIVIMDGLGKLPSQISNVADLQEMLQAIASTALVDESLQGAEILWSPTDSKDTLTKRDIVKDYPELRVL